MSTSSGSALDGQFTHQTRVHQVAQIVVRRALEERGSTPLTASKISRTRRAPGVFHQERHDGVALRSALQAAVLEECE